MKRLRKCLLIAVFCLAAAMLVQPVKAQAKNPSKVVLKVGKTYKKYDVTGDKKKDRFKATVTKNKYGEPKKITLSVNGKKTNLKGNNAFAVTIRLYTLKNGKTYIQVRGVSGDYTSDMWSNLYQYKKGKMRKVVNLYKYARKKDSQQQSWLRVSGNRIIVKRQANTKGLGCITFKYAYTYESGALKLESKNARVVDIAGYDWDYSKYCGTLAYDRTLYTSPAMNKGAGGFLAAGSSVDITHIYLPSLASDYKYARVRIKEYHGKVAWIKCTNSYDYLILEEATCVG